MENVAKAFFETHVEERDPLVANALANERRRQQNQIELIASENIVSRAVLDALGHEMTMSFVALLGDSRAQQPSARRGRGGLGDPKS